MIRKSSNDESKRSQTFPSYQSSMDDSSRSSLYDEERNSSSSPEAGLMASSRGGEGTTTTASTSSTLPIRKTSAPNKKKRRSTRTIFEVIQRAFSIDYESVSTRDIDDDEYDDDDNKGPDQSEKTCYNPRFTIAALGLLSVAVVYALIYGWKHRMHSLSSLGVVTTLDYTGDETSPTTTCDATTGGKESVLSSLYASSVASGLKYGAVAADHPLCSQMGLRILRDLRGNAVDAAVTVALCLGVANPASSGLGGGAFLLVHADGNNSNQHAENKPSFIDARTVDVLRSKSGKISEVIDCREVAPAAAFRDMYLAEGVTEDASVVGGLAIAVPGELRGLELAHARHGRLSWAAVVDPVVQLAQNGVPVNQNLAHEIQFVASAVARQGSANHHLRLMLTKDDDWSHPLQEGDLLFRPRFAETLAAIRDHGADALYKGDRAKLLAKDIQDAGGIVTAIDIENYKATLRNPVVGRGMNGVSMLGVPPPSSGGAAIIGAARFLAGFGNALAMLKGGLAVHRVVESLKHVFAIRMSLSDPAFNSDVVVDAVHDMVEGDYMGQLRRGYYRDNSTLPLSQYGGIKWSQLKDSDGAKEAKDAKEGDRQRRHRSLAPRRFGYLDDHGTTHFAIVDRDGNAVTATSSVNTYFGSGVVSSSTGILLSNTMDDFGNPGRPNFFGLRPSEANFIAPGKKPLSSMSPTMVFRDEDKDDSSSDRDNRLGDLILVLGASGGPKIVSAVTNVIVNHIWLGMSLFEAIVHPRVHDQLIYHGAAVTTWDNSVVSSEGGDKMLHLLVSNRTQTALKRRNHALLGVDYMGTVQAISIDLETGMMTAACDVRKGGTPAGY